MVNRSPSESGHASDDPHSLDRSASLRLMIVMSRALRAVSASTREHLKEHDLSMTEFGVLEALYHKGALPLSALAERVLITGASMTYTVKQLETRGLIRRRPCAEDQRVVFGELTEEGTKLIARVFPEHAEQLRIAMRGLTRHEKRQAADLLKRLGHAAAELP